MLKDKESRDLGLGNAEPDKLPAQEKPLYLLDFFTPETPTWTQSLLAAASGLSVPTCLRALRVLQRYGLVQREGEAYRLGVRLVSLGHIVKEQFPARDVALPHLRGLRDLTEQSVQWVVRDGEAAGVYLIVVPSRQPVRLYVMEGRRAPLYSGASTRLLLAFAPSEVRERVMRQPRRALTPSTPTAATALRRHLHVSRRTWLAYSVEELELYSAELAAPILDAENSVIAAVSVAGLAAHFHEEGRLMELAESLTSTAEAISRELGYSGAWGADPDAFFELVGEFVAEPV